MRPTTTTTTTCFVGTSPDAIASTPPLIVVDEAVVRENVKSYYGKTLQSSQDLQTNACTTTGASSYPPHIKAMLSRLHDTTLAKYYGCGLCLPNYDLTGAHVLDLGCGAGRDVYLASQLVGSSGRVVGVDMTPEQLQWAREVQPYHAELFGYDNVEFVHGYLERLNEIQDSLQPESFDLIISNCVMNLCADKAAVLKSCYDLLKPGGELYFSDVYASRRVPQQLQQDSVLWGECISGAMYWKDFLHMAKHQAGFTDPRLVEDSPIVLKSKIADSIAHAVGGMSLTFHSATYRLIKLPDLEPDGEDYGQAVTYRGTLPYAPASFTLNKNQVFETGRVLPVSGNTWRMLQMPRLRDHFEFIGNFNVHYGSFARCGEGKKLPFSTTSTKGSSVMGSCC